MRSTALKKIKHRNFIWAQRIDIIDALNLAMIFFFFLTPQLNLLLQTYVRFILFPLAAIMANVACVWQARMTFTNTDKKGHLDKGDLFWLGLRIIGAIAITAAVIAGFSGIAALAKVPSLMFIFTLSLGGLVHRDAFHYRWGQSNAPSNTPEQQHSIFGMAIEHAIVMVGLLITDLAVATTMLLGFTACAPLGIVGGAILVANSIRSHIREMHAWNKEQADEQSKLEKGLHTPHETPGKAPRQTAQHRAARRHAHGTYAGLAGTLGVTVRESYCPPQVVDDVPATTAESLSRRHSHSVHWLGQRRSRPANGKARRSNNDAGYRRTNGLS